MKEAIRELKLGRPIIVVDDEDRENEGDLVALSDLITPEIVNFMITYGRGLVCTSVEYELAKRIGLTLMTTNNNDPFATAFAVSVDYKDTTTGISAYERAMTIRAMVDPSTTKEDFNQPGHVFPLLAKEGGVLARPGHTEASVDLARLCGATPSGVICEIIKADGTMARLPDLKKMAKQFGLIIISVEQLIDYRIKINEERRINESSITR
ncbi:MAG: 3,4-dihydroxy-2-butanone-4-phosphate synthase [Bacillus sp. (in: Bacteria)]|nr:3,4-dihydroxy-2-butanone-4-phosphate synthase [Bacillus sp. (in: firmicutes)]